MEKDLAENRNKKGVILSQLETAWCASNPNVSSVIFENEDVGLYRKLLLGGNRCLNLLCHLVLVMICLVSVSAFAFLFSEIVQYNQTQVDNIGELERRLEDAGYAVGARVLELLCHREKLARGELTQLTMTGKQGLKADGINEILEEEEALIAAHRKEIEDTMEIVREEMKLLVEVDQPGSLIDNYLVQLSFLLSRKATSLVSLQARLSRFQHRLKQQEILSRKRVPR